MKTMKKILCALLVVVMCLTSAPVGGFVGLEFKAKAVDYEVGDIIEFGSYPQSEVTDSVTITALNSKAPEWDDWKSYGYYTGTGTGDYGTMKQGDWMRYTDIMYNGNKYRGVKFTQYRPNYTCNPSPNTLQDDNGYSTNTVYWFKFEPIDWRVLDPATGLVMCETIIDSQPYSNTIYYNSGASGSIYAYFNDSSYTNYASDYETSSIRKWLNNDFYNTAFTDSEKKEINTTTLNNDGYFTSVGTTGCEKLDSNSTNDKIFLLSYNEVRNSNYGFNSSATAYDTARRAQGSDYAKSQGLYVSTSSSYYGNSYWLLRSPGDYSISCCGVGGDGNAGSLCHVDYTDFGVRPALRFNRISDIGQSEHQHSYTSEITTEPTHTTLGVKTYTCECGDTYTEEIAKTEGHSYTSAVTKEPTHLEEGIITYTCECGYSYIEPIPKLEYKVGDIIQFGWYPQSKVTDSATITALNNKAPEWDDWISYGYYSGDDKYGTMVQGDWMRYTDVTYNGNKYRGVKFTQYRPDFTCNKSSLLYTTYQYDNGYRTNTVYWFKFEPIDWRVLDPATGLVMCETIIDSQPYSNTIYYNSGASDSIYAYFNDSSYTNYASDYETSSIRKWLNNDFYNTAFTDSEKKEINTTTLNNDGYYTSVGTTGYEKLDSNSTNDKIFLLSYNEVRNSNYGFNSSSSAYDPARFAQGSDYAQSQGLYVLTSSSYYGNSSWLLRSPGYDSHGCCYVYCNGNSINYFKVSITDIGVRPALIFNRISDSGQSEHQHSYTPEITTEATHTTVGVKTYTCECGDTYTEEIAKTEGHSYISAVTKEPTHLEEGIITYTCECGDTYTEKIAKAEGHSYEKVVTEPTCTAKGYTTYTCACGDTYVDDYTDKLDHNYTSTVTTEPTHLEEGIITYTCECGDTYTESIPKLTKHTYVGTVTAPTCTTQGYITYTCECGDSYVDDIVEARHTFSAEWTIDEDPTCKYEGVKSRHCEFCPARTDFAPIGKLTHDFVSVRVEPSCLDEGYIMSVCYNCGEEIIETIEPTGHDFDGSKCTVCDYDKADDCNCNCHKGGIPGLFWKIINFFNKLFKSKQYCSCGAKHW